MNNINENAIKNLVLSNVLQSNISLNNTPEKTPVGRELLF